MVQFPQKLQVLEPLERLPCVPELAVLSLGLAARYASGYLLTEPPPGKPRLIGQDASHAWVSVAQLWPWLWPSGFARPGR